MHNVLAIEDNLIEREMHMGFKCSLSNHDVENVYHLFLICMYTLLFWNWMVRSFDINIDIISYENLFKLPGRS